ncbi:MAG: head GIN domain-containing protein [Bacteroidota bacterium]
MNFLKNKFRLLVCALASLLFNTCTKENLFDCFKSTGKETSVVRNLLPFQRVLVYDKLDVILIEDSVYKVRLEGGENILTLVKTDIVNGELVLSNNNKCNVVRSYKRKIRVFVYAPKFSEITHRGVGDIKTESVLHTDSIKYQVLNSGNVDLNIDNKYIYGIINGMGNINCTGKTITHILNANGEAHVNCGSLETLKSDYYLKLSGPSYLTANQELRVIIRHSGNVYYKGNPNIVYNQNTGSGKLISGF